MNSYGIMAILQTCCLFNSVRIGSFASAIYTLVRIHLFLNSCYIIHWGSIFPLMDILNHFSETTVTTFSRRRYLKKLAQILKCSTHESWIFWCIFFFSKNDGWNHFLLFFLLMVFVCHWGVSIQSKFQLKIPRNKKDIQWIWWW